MAPRGRKKVGLKRIDAAVDALIPLGFSRELVVKTVNNLLKVYDGNEGWVFIEEGSYRLVIDSILEAQENEETEEVEQKAEDEIVPAEITEQIVQEDDHTSSPCTLEAMVDTHDFGENADWKDISCTVPSMMSGLQLENQAALDTGETGEERDMSLNIVGLYQQCQPSVPSRPRRVPCYGWISEDEDDGELGPEAKNVVISRRERVEGSNCYSCRERKRPSGWDQKPSDTS